MKCVTKLNFGIENLIDMKCVPVRLSGNHFIAKSEIGKDIGFFVNL